MKRLFTISSVLVACAFAISMSSSVMAQGHEGHDHGATQSEKAGKFLGKGDGIETCPVTGEPISKSVTAELMGRTIYFCCTDCVAKAKANPELYVKPTAEEQKKAVGGSEKGSGAPAEFLGKGDGITTCPVTGSPVNKELKSEVNGRTFYVCCAGCVDTVKANPDAYLKRAAKD
jgi:YHS domain-containing protein